MELHSLCWGAGRTMCHLWIVSASHHFISSPHPWRSSQGSWSCLLMYIVHPPESTEYYDPLVVSCSYKILLSGTQSLNCYRTTWGGQNGYVYLLTRHDGASETVSAPALGWVLITPSFECQPLIWWAWLVCWLASTVRLLGNFCLRPGII